MGPIILSSPIKIVRAAVVSCVLTVSSTDMFLVISFLLTTVAGRGY